MISPTEPARCCDEQRNAPEWWTRCEEQGRRLRESLFHLFIFQIERQTAHSSTF
jgi:hypothetical protein